MTEYLTLAGYGGACLAAASTGMLFKPGAWYAGLDKPAWTPPNIAFPVVWTILYVLMAAAAWRVAVRAPEAGAAGLALWTLQITLNALWSPVFFGLHRPRIALAVIGPMWAALAGTVVTFAGADRVAALMMAPVLVWGAYAAALNLSVMRRNGPSAFGPEAQG